MRRGLPLVTLLVLIIPLIGCGGGGGGTAANVLQPNIVVPAAASNGSLVIVGGSIPISVRVTDRSGAPQAGKTVTFVAPRIGAGATLSSRQAGGSNVFQGQTDATGMLSVTLTANGTPGPYLVTAAVEDTGQMHAVAVTNLSALRTPSLTAQQARDALKQELLGSQPEDELKRLYGPVLLPAGSQITTDGPRADGLPFPAMSVTQDSWFFWLDEAPLAQFGHPVKFVLMRDGDGSDGFLGRATRADAFWYPRVQVPGTASMPLMPAHEIEGNYRPANCAAAPARQNTAPDDACAILLYGPRGWAHDNAVQRFREFLTNSNRVKPDYVFPPSTTDNPNTLQDLKDYIAQAKAAGCKKIYFLFAGHGGQEIGSGLGGGFIEMAGPTPGGPSQNVSYNDLASLMQQLGNVELCAHFQCCYAARAFTAFQNRGFTGTVTGASSTTEFSWKNDWYGNMYVIDEMIECWKDTAANTNGDSKVDQSEAFTWMLANAGKNRFWSAHWKEWTLKGNPQQAGIGSGQSGGDTNLPTINIVQAGDTVTASIPTPPGVTPNLRAEIFVSMGPGGVAAISGSNSGFAPGGGTVPIQFTGISQGTTTYTVFARSSNGLIYHGSGVINVGSFFKGTPNPLVLFVNESGIVNVTKEGAIATTQDFVTAGVTSSNTSVAAATQAVLVFPGGVNLQPLGIRAGSVVGELTITLIDLLTV